MNENMLLYYKGVLEDLESKKAPLKAQIAELEQLIEGIRKNMPSKLLNALMTTPLASTEPEERFKNMSMRWAILQYLSEVTPESRPTSDIASSLISGGFPNSLNFNSKVSAILSQMAAKNEAVRDDQEWKISQHGRDIWEAIKVGDKYINRHLLNAASEGDV